MMTWRRLKPFTRATSTRRWGASWKTCRVARVTGTAAALAISTYLRGSPIPNSSRANGSQPKTGICTRALKVGSSSALIRGDRPMAAPSSMPRLAPSRKPTNTRCRLAPACSQRSPLRASSTSVSYTKLSGGSTCGETQPCTTPSCQTASAVKGNTKGRAGYSQRRCTAKTDLAGGRAVDETGGRGRASARFMLSDLLQ